MRPVRRGTGAPWTTLPVTFPLRLPSYTATRQTISHQPFIFPRTSAQYAITSPPFSTQRPANLSSQNLYMIPQQPMAAYMTSTPRPVIPSSRRNVSNLTLNIPQNQLGPGWSVPSTVPSNFISTPSTPTSNSISPITPQNAFDSSQPVYHLGQQIKGFDDLIHGYQNTTQNPE